MVDESDDEVTDQALDIFLDKGWIKEDTLESESPMPSAAQESSSKKSVRATTIRRTTTSRSTTSARKSRMIDNGLSEGMPL